MKARSTGSPWSFDAAAEFLTVSARHLMRLADAGKLKTIRIGHRRLIPDVEVIRIAKEGC
ncbi:MAG: DNA-binding protein [Planctomycetaceae bacterium]|nr:DNA-binding protein [Planctomycetaceae bacterium]